jgi:non-heme chloroperoxidase
MLAPNPSNPRAAHSHNLCETARMTVKTFRTRSAVKLVAEERGPPTAPAVLFLHGGGQTRHSWNASLDAVAAAGCYALSLDLRGHGDSDWAPDGDYRLPTLAADIEDVVAQLPTLPILIGASMGGLASLWLVGSSPVPMARALVLVDVVPQLEIEGTLEIRNFMHANPEGFATVEEAAAAVSAYLPHRKQRPSNSPGLMKNLRLRDDGRYYWHWDPAILGGERGLDPRHLHADLEEAARRVHIPTLLIRGGSSRIVSMEGVAAWQRLVPHAEFANVERAEHMVAGDANDAFNAPLLEFVGRLKRPAIR